MRKQPWWLQPLVGRSDGIAMNWADAGLAQKALTEGKTLEYYFRTGTMAEGVTIEGVLNELRDLGLKAFYHKLPYQNSEEWYLLNELTGLCLQYQRRTRETSLFFHCLDPALTPALQAAAEADIVKTVTKGRVYIVVQDSTGPQLHQMGDAGEAFEEGNYRAEVVEGYRHVAEDLNKSDPCGRLIVLDGPPGTGKTHMVRALLNEAPKATFVLVPPAMMSSLSSPTFVKVLLDERRKGAPLVLVIEDADECLASRKADNLSEISALLNFTDGIFGAVMDLRVVATTNVEMHDLDAAALRPGRLCRRIEVGKLDPDQAEAVYRRLAPTGPTGQFTKGNYYTLGEIYALARGHGFELKKPKGRIGFQAEPEEEVVPLPEAADIQELIATLGGAENIEYKGVVEDEAPEDDDSDLIDEDPPADPDDEHNVPYKASDCHWDERNEPEEDDK